MKKIIFIHLFNDNSGSPKVLRETIRAVCAHKMPAKLYVGSDGDGILSTCGIPTSHYWYRRTGKPPLTLVTFLTSQFLLFCQLLFDRSIAKDAIIYVNTLLPFGAALYGKLTARRVIYHVHEISITPMPLKFLLTSIARHTSSMNIYVSDAHMQALPLPGPPAQRVYNALGSDFLRKARASSYEPQRNGNFTVLMVASLRDYKGVLELLGLAASLVDNGEIRFELVVNDDSAAISHYFIGRELPPNLTVYPRTSDTSKFYGRASLLLNLSRVDQWLETFGLTILEAMAYGVPVIVPPVGGPTELVDDGVQGFWVDSRNRVELRKRVLQLCVDPGLCQRMSQACHDRAAEFSPEVFANMITTVINRVRGGDV